jgi:hypothetical protein
MNNDMSELSLSKKETFMGEILKSKFLYFAMIILVNKNSLPLDPWIFN